jgi:hypothetical protein
MRRIAARETTLRRSLAVAALLAATVARANGTPPASCPIGSAWTQTWSQPDTYTPTTLTYSLTSPCFVTFNTDFVVTVAVSDTLCVSSTPVSSGTQWAVSDTRLDGSNATSVIGGYGSPGGGVGMVFTVNGSFVTTVAQHYGPAGTPTDHRIKLSFIPRDVDACGPSAHFWPGPTLIGTTTYDPYGPTSDGSASTAAPAAAAPADSAGGCASAGVTPALLGLAALAAAGWPRRRARG